MQTKHLILKPLHPLLRNQWMYSCQSPQLVPYSNQHNLQSCCARQISTFEVPQTWMNRGVNSAHQQFACLLRTAAHTELRMQGWQEYQRLCERGLDIHVRVPVCIASKLIYIRMCETGTYLPPENNVHVWFKSESAVLQISTKFSFPALVRGLTDQFASMLGKACLKKRFGFWGRSSRCCLRSCCFATMCCVIFWHLGTQ